MSCDCSCFDKDKSVVLDLPSHIDIGRKTRTVTIDKCIANVIKHLWLNNIQTKGCCCGHNKGVPSVGIDSKYIIKFSFPALVLLFWLPWFPPPYPLANTEPANIAIIAITTNFFIIISIFIV